MVMVIIGVGVLSMLQLLAAGTVFNGDAAELTTAMTLAGNVREMSLGLAFYDPEQDPKVAPRVWFSKEPSINQYDNIMDLDGDDDTWDRPDDPDRGYQRFSPPRNGIRRTIDGYDNWAQWVKVENVSPSNFRVVLPHDPDTEAVRLTVKVTRGGNLVYRTSWIIFAPLAANRD